MSKLVRLFVGGARKAVPRIFTYVGGARRKVVRGFVYVGGVRKQFFVSNLVQLIATSAFRGVGSGAASATLEFRTDGFCYATQNALGLTQRFQWKLSPDAASTFEIRCASIQSGTAFSTQPAAVGTWIALSATRSWTNSVASMAGTHETNCTFELRQAAVPGVILASVAGFSVDATSG